MVDTAGFLREHGYETSIMVDGTGLALHVTGGNIVVHGWEDYEGCPFELRADHAEAWTKPSLAAVRVKSPETEEERFQLLELFWFLGTNEAKELSLAGVKDPRFGCSS